VIRVESVVLYRVFKTVKRVYFVVEHSYSCW